MIFLAMQDLTDIIIRLYTMFIGFIITWYNCWDSIIILRIGDIRATVLDFFIGITVVSIVLGAFLRISSADKFYGDR